MIIQKKAVKLRAWRLGDHSPMEEDLTARGLIQPAGEGEYLLFSQETRDCGQKAVTGDYFKVDGTGAPYPNDRAYFEKNHISLGDGWYLQKTRPLPAWNVDCPVCPELRFLLDKGKLTVDETAQDAYFSAFLWGARLFAARDAIIVFDRVELDGDTVTDVEFHFVARDEFLKTYDILEERRK